MPEYIYITDGTNTLYLDNVVNEMSFGGNKRAWNIKEYGGANGGYVGGGGNFGIKTFKFLRNERRDAGDIHFWNSRRDDFIKFFTKPAYITNYLYAKDGEDSAWWRIPVVCTDVGDLKFKNFRVPDKTDFTLIGYTGCWEAVTATTGNLAITSANEHSLSFTNGGTIECSPTFNFTPTGNEEYLTIASTEGHRFLIENTFTAGVLISYNMANGVLSVGGATVDLYNYLVQGSHFKIDVGTSTLYITASGPGAFTYSFYARKI